jgi:hypothetical protein
LGSVIGADLSVSVILGLKITLLSEHWTRL